MTEGSGRKLSRGHSRGRGGGRVGLTLAVGFLVARGAQGPPGRSPVEAFGVRQSRQEEGEEEGHAGEGSEDKGECPGQEVLKERRREAWAGRQPGRLPGPLPRAHFSSP